MKRDQAIGDVYQELRALASAKLAKESVGHTLSPTALVHEVYIRLVQQGDKSYADREHFFRVAANAIRQTLIDHARTKKRVKRGGAYKRLGIEGIDIAAPRDTTEFETDDLVALAEAVERLEADDPQLARIVMLRFFSEASMADIAVELGVSERTVYNDWRAAKAKLLSLMPD